MKKSTFLFMVSLYCFSSNIAAVSLSDAKLVPSLSTPGIGSYVWKTIRTVCNRIEHVQ